MEIQAILAHYDSMFGKYSLSDIEAYLYKNIDKLAKHLLEFAPEDKKAIKRLRRDVKLFEGVFGKIKIDVKG